MNHVQPNDEDEDDDMYSTFAYSIIFEVSFLHQNEDENYMGPDNADPLDLAKLADDTSRDWSKFIVVDDSDDEGPRMIGHGRMLDYGADDDEILRELGSLDPAITAIYYERG